MVYTVYRLHKLPRFTLFGSYTFGLPVFIRVHAYHVFRRNACKFLSTSKRQIYFKVWFEKRKKCEMKLVSNYLYTLKSSFLILKDAFWWQIMLICCVSVLFKPVSELAMFCAAVQTNNNHAGLWS